jgi:hypothetical protein
MKKVGIVKVLFSEQSLAKCPKSTDLCDQARYCTLEPFSRTSLTPPTKSSRLRKVIGFFLSVFRIGYYLHLLPLVISFSFQRSSYTHRFLVDEMGFEKLDYAFPPQGRLSKVRDAVLNYWPKSRPPPCSRTVTMHDIGSAVLIAWIARNTT